MKTKHLGKIKTEKIKSTKPCKKSKYEGVEIFNKMHCLVKESGVSLTEAYKELKYYLK